VARITAILTCRITLENIDLLLENRHQGRFCGDMYRQIKKLDPALSVCFLTAFEYQMELEQLLPELDGKADVLTLSVSPSSR
jgi:hypothetical protein